MKARFIFRNFIQHTAVSSDGMARIHIFPKKFDLKCPNIDLAHKTMTGLKKESFVDEGTSFYLIPTKACQSLLRQAGTQEG